MKQATFGFEPSRLAKIRASGSIYFEWLGWKKCRDDEQGLEHIYYHLYFHKPTATSDKVESSLQAHL